MMWLKISAFIGCVISGFLLCAWMTAKGVVPVGDANAGGMIALIVVTGLSAMALRESS